MKAEEISIRQVMSATTLIGDKVVDTAQEDIGKIEEIMIHLPSGKVAFAVLSLGGSLSVEDKLFAVPWEVLRLDEDQKCLLLPVDKETLKKAPGFDKNHWPDMTNPNWGDTIHTYYGCKPIR